MRRLARHVFSACSVASALLCFATCVLCVRSFWVGDVWTLAPAPPGYVRHISSFRSAAGDLIYVRQNSILPGGPPGWGTMSPEAAHIWWDPQMRKWEIVDVSYYSMGPGPVLSAVYVPYWIPVALTFPLPVLWLGRRLRQRARVKTGLCRACGYDLRATPDRCPECGQVA